MGDSEKFNVDDLFSTIAAKHHNRFTESLPRYESTYEAEQESRQTRLKDKYATITVHVAREDYLYIQATVELKFLHSAAQGAWPTFLSEVRRKLNMDFIDSIYDKFDESPVHRTLRLQDGGHYVVRQREESSVLEVIQSGERPGKIIWPITKYINSSKEILADIAHHRSAMDVRVDRLINEPQVRARQRGISVLLLQAAVPDDVLKIVYELIAPKEERLYHTEEEVIAIRKENAKKADPELDSISLYRTSLESLNRVAVRGYMEEIAADRVVKYIIETIEQYMAEVDIVVVGMKLISDIVKVLTRRTDDILHLILNGVQCYSPPSQPGTTRVVKRLLPDPEEVARKKEEEDRRIHAEMKAKEERDMIELAAKIEAKEKAAAAAALETVATKVSLPKVDMKTERRREKARKAMKKRMEQSSTRSNAPCTVPSARQGSPQRTIRGPPTARVLADTSRLAASVTSTDKETPKTAFVTPLTCRRPLKSLAPVDTKPKKKAGMWDSFGAAAFDDEDEVVRGDINPLPTVAGVKFTAIKGSSRNNMALVQCIMTTFQFLNTHYANREVAYGMAIHEELCDVGLVCLHLPQVLTYIIWTVNKILTDRLEEAENRAQAALSRKKALSTKQDESESNLSIGSDYENRSETAELERVIATVTRPVDTVILFFAACTHILQLDDTDVATCCRWVAKWDDKSRSYGLLKARGREMANL